jgi:hypothetical protein
MPQFKLTSGDPNKDSAQAVPNNFSIQVKSGIEAEFPHNYFATAYAKLPDGRKKSFTAHGSLTQADRMRLADAIRKYERAQRNSDLLPVSWFTVKQQLEDQYEKEINELEWNMRHKARDWWDEQLHRNPVRHMPRVERFVTGINPSRVVPHLADFKYVWIRNNQDPSEAGETLAAFTDQREPGEKLIRLDQHREGYVHGSHMSSIYVLVTPEQWADVKNKITGLNRDKVGRRLMQ